MRTVSTCLSGLTTASNRGLTDNWRRIVDRVRMDLLTDGIELDPPNLPELFARAIMGELPDGKGLLFMGGTGSGKTRRMSWLAGALDISWTDAVTLAEACRDEGAFRRRLNLDVPQWDQVPPHWNDLVIDDLGTEPETVNAFGTVIDAIGKAITFRHVMFPGAVTHYTTNLNREQLERRYGERIISRLEEMCFFVPLIHADRRRER